jgi:hemerythrin-like domain-containing protein
MSGTTEYAPFTSYTEHNELSDMQRSLQARVEAIENEHEQAALRGEAAPALMSYGIHFRA